MGNRLSFHFKSFPSANYRTVCELRNEESPADSQIYHPCVLVFLLTAHTLGLSKILPLRIDGNKVGGIVFYALRFYGLAT